MTTSPAVQAAKKKMQLARLEKKENDPEGYPEYYANQPAQLERAQAFKVYRDARQALKDADEALEVAIVTGEGLERAKETQAIAALVVERARPPRRGENLTSNLSGA